MILGLSAMFLLLLHYCVQETTEILCRLLILLLGKMHFNVGRDLLKVCWAGWAGTEPKLGLGRLLDSSALCDNSSHPLAPLSPQKDFTLILSFDPHLNSKVLQERTRITMRGGNIYSVFNICWHCILLYVNDLI